MPAECAADAPSAAVEVPEAPSAYRVVARRVETADVVTLALEPSGGPLPPARPGQFAMLWAYGVGEVPISYSGITGDGGLHHTVRSVGAVTAALCALAPGGSVGVRGPFGRGWDLAGARGGDVAVVAGGIGLAPLRPAFEHLLAHRAAYGRVALLAGARAPGDLLFVEDLERWRGRLDTNVEVTVDAAPPSWHGDVGVVTNLLGRVPLDPHRTTALLCGPEVMMRFAARGLLDLGVPADRIQVSLERNMQCATGQCGHCQVGPRFVCRDGPVFPWPRVAPHLEVKER